MNSTIADKPQANRFEIAIGRQVVGFITYQRTTATLSLLRTETDTRLAGQGCGEALVRRVLDAARVEGLSVLPVCPIVHGFLRQHPEYLDLVPAHQRERFRLPVA
jgi:uncharacterized protein